MELDHLPIETMHQDLLFLSKKAIFEPPKAIRSGRSWTSQGWDEGMDEGGDERNRVGDAGDEGGWGGMGGSRRSDCAADPVGVVQQGRRPDLLPAIRDDGAHALAAWLRPKPDLRPGGV